MNIKAMPMAASNTSESSATIMAIPRCCPRCVFIFLFMVYSFLVVHQASHTRHCDLNVLGCVRVLALALCGQCNADRFDGLENADHTRPSQDRKTTPLNSIPHLISYPSFCFK